MIILALSATYYYQITLAKDKTWKHMVMDLSRIYIRRHHLLNMYMYYSGWETSTRPLTNASENLAGRVENRPGRVGFCIGYIRDYPGQASATKF